MAGTSGSDDGRLSGIADLMMEPLSAPANRGVRAIVLLDDGEFGGLMTHGYSSRDAVLADLVVHARAAFRACGGDIVLMTGSPEGLSDG